MPAFTDLCDKDNQDIKDTIRQDLPLFAPANPLFLTDLNQRPAFAEAMAGDAL